MSSPPCATGPLRAEQGALVRAPTAPLAETGTGRLLASVRRAHPASTQHIASYGAFWKWSVQHPALFWEALWHYVGIVASRPWDAAVRGPGHALDQPGSEPGPTPGPSSPPPPPIWPPPLWFVGSRLNFAENLLRFCSPSQPSGTREKVALVSAAEGRPGPSGDKTYTRAQLWSAVASAVRALQSLGVRPGDRVATYASNIGENLIAFLAASALGAIWVSAAADLAPDAVVDRLSMTRPRVLFTVNATAYGGKVHDHLGKLDEVVRRLLALPSPAPAPAATAAAPEPPATNNTDPALGPSLACRAEDRLESVVVIQDLPVGPSLAEVVSERDIRSREAQTGVKYYGWDDLVSSHAAGPQDSIPFAQLDFNFPLWILFSSGTTGLPKAIVHRAGGMLLQFAKEHMVHGDVAEGEVLHYYSSVGWMMWNYSIATLFTGATLVLYDGAPLSPPRVLWDLSDRLGVTIFGTSAAYLSALASSGFVPRDHFPHLHVKQVLSTGSPLRSDLYPFILDAIGDVLIGSITGGTDICSLFGAHCTALPVYAGEVQCRGLGMDVAVAAPAAAAHSSSSANTGAKEVKVLPPNEEGDLICRTAFPVQPLGFWNQPVKRYFDSYYATTPGCWHHGDFVMLSDHGGLVMRGRSDGVLNPGGIRFGSSDIYEVLDVAITSSSPHHDGSSSPSSKPPPLIGAIQDALAVGLPTPQGDDEVVVLFLDVDRAVIPEGDAAVWAALTQEVKQLLRLHRSPRHVPSFVERVSPGGVVKTLNGKKVEVPIKKILSGQPTSIVNPATLANPEALGQYAIIAERLREQLALQQQKLAHRLAEMNNV